MKKFSKLTKKNLLKNRYSLLTAIIIAILAFLHFLHDFEFFKGKDGFSGFPSLRLGVWVVSMFVISISGWVFAFLNAKGKRYRFVILAPIVTLLFQLFIYVLDKRDAVVNGVSVKVLLNFGFLLVIIIAYYFFKVTRDNK